MGSRSHTSPRHDIDKNAPNWRSGDPSVRVLWGDPVSGAGGARPRSCRASHYEPTTPLSVVRYHSIVRTRPARHGAGAAVIMAPATPAADVPVVSPPSLTQGGCGDATNDAAWPHVAEAVSEATEALDSLASLFLWCPT